MGVDEASAGRRELHVDLLALSTGATLHAAGGGGEDRPGYLVHATAVEARDGRHRAAGFEVLEEGVFLLKIFLRYDVMQRQLVVKWLDFRNNENNRNIFLEFKNICEILL